MSGKVKAKSPWTAIFDGNANNIRKLTCTPKMASAPNKAKSSMTTLKTTTTTKTKSSSSVVVVRPKTLNVTRDDKHAETKIFIGEALNAWRAKARCSVVPAERLKELFHELQFYPSEKQISEMLQTAKVFARKGSKQLNGLTFGEFCVLAADLKRFRMCNFSSSTDPKTPSNAPEVFLGGSCNPTTWRADVAIPTLESLGISFYNPQVSDWTPDLIELEHRAKEKARVLFFVMDSETRASAGAIEAAHIAGQNARQLVLVLHPYKPDQCILNEQITPQEFLDLSRNQQMLRELVTCRGLPVLDNIPSGLQRTKQILAGFRDPPSKIASILLEVRRAFNRVLNSVDDEITMDQCQRALSLLGYPNSLLSTENLSMVILSQRESLENSLPASSGNVSTNHSPKRDSKETSISFDEFCVLAAYLSVLQHESGCISPIKGTNLPPPPIFLANMQEDFRNGDECVTITTSYSKHVLRTSSCTSVPDDRMDFYRNRDSGTSSPQPLETVKSKYIHIGKRSKISVNMEFVPNGDIPGDESDSNDSVFSSGSSINSNFCDSSSGLELRRDVYLGGSCFLRTRWRQDYAIPYLTSKGITYHLPSLHESIPQAHLDGFYKGESEKLPLDTRVGLKLKTKPRTKRKDCSLKNTQEDDEDTEEPLPGTVAPYRPNLFNPDLLDSSRVLLFVITNETRSLAPMTLAAHCIGLMYNVVLCVQMLPEFCKIGEDRLTPTAIKDYNRGRSYLIDLAKRQGVPVFNDLKSALECTVEKVRANNSRNSV